MGHPARYVQGYYVERKDTDTLVTENRAHAWAEVYFDNFGLIAFEATPGYSITEGWTVTGTVGEVKEIRQNQLRAFCFLLNIECDILTYMYFQGD